MKILKLSFLNINSLKGYNEINFENTPFNTTGIFAIIGPTGAGKSSILDAITLALFNQTPRTGKISSELLSRLGSVITRNTDEARAEIEYEANNMRIRSSWSVHRAKSGKLQDYDMSVVDILKNDNFSLKKSEVPAKNAEIIGLNYDQFIKSVLLSQGDFAAFLKASTADKSAILEKITGTFIYREIGKAAFEKNKIELIVLENLKEKLKNLYLPEDIEIEQLNLSEIELKNLCIFKKSKLQTSEPLLIIKNNIASLNNEIYLLSQQLQNLENEKNNLQSRFERLKKHEEILPLQAEIQNFLNIKAKILEISLKISEKEKIKNQLQDKFDSEKLLAEKNRINFMQFSSEYELLKPLIKEVRTIDNQIISAQEVEKEAQNQLSDKNFHLKNSEIECKELELLLYKETKEINKKHVDVSTNVILKDLNIELPLIKEKIKQNEIDKNSFENSLKLNISVDLLSEIKLVKKAVDKLELIRKDVLLSEEKLEKFKTLNSNNFVISDLRNKKDYISALNQHFKKQIEISSEFFKNKSLIEENNIFINNYNTKLSDLNLSKEKFEYEIIIIKKYIEELLIRFERQKLEAKYSEDRKLLKQNEPCYLCGSVHHPFVQSYTNVFDKTKEQIQLKQSELKELENQLKEAENAINITLVNSQNISSKIDEISNKNLDFQRVFDLNNLEINFNNSILDKDKIIKLLEDNINQEKQIFEKIQIYELSETEKINYNNLKIIEEKAVIFQNSSFEVGKSIEKYSTFLNKPRNTNDVIEQLQKLSDLYNLNINEYERLKNLIETNTKLLEEKTKQFATIFNECELYKIKANEKNELLSNLLKLRFEKLENKNTDELESNSEKQLQIFITSISDKEKQILQIESDLKSVSTSIIEETESMQSYDNKYIDAQLSLFPKLKIYDIQEPEDAAKLILNTKEVEELKLLKQKYESQIIQINSVLIEKNNTLHEFNLKDDTSISLEKLHAEIQEIKSGISNHEIEIGVLKNKLETIVIIKNRAFEISQQIEIQRKEMFKWELLKNYIGDADGKRYAKFAQELTLLQLISLANHHLQSFYKRYFIKKDKLNDDDLVIVDTFIANTGRSVKTLSGGESFMVSLALALGLSDLAGKNTKIESLFIDEGFGTLDPDSLDQALTALENLQNQSNRTIGIISHVQALRERIPVQIRLKKGGSGYSVMEIIN